MSCFHRSNNNCDWFIGTFTAITVYLTIYMIHAYTHTQKRANKAVKYMKMIEQRDTTQLRAAIGWAGYRPGVGRTPLLQPDLTNTIRTVLTTHSPFTRQPWAIQFRDRRHSYIFAGHSTNPDTRKQNRRWPKDAPWSWPYIAIYTATGNITC